MANRYLITCFFSLLFPGQLMADMATKQGEQVYLYHPSASLQHIERGKCSDPQRPIYNRATCQASIRSVSFPALREELEAKVGINIPNLESRLSERIARILDLDRQLLDYFEGSSAEEESKRIKRRMENQRIELGVKEGARYELADQIARIQAQLAVDPSDDLRNLLAARRQELESVQSEIAIMSDELSKVTNEFLQSQSGIISTETFIGLTKTREQHAVQMRALQKNLDQEIGAVASMRRLLAYVRDDSNVYEIRTEGQAFSELFNFLDLFIAAFNKLSQSPGPAEPGPGSTAWVSSALPAIEVCQGDHWPSDIAANEGLTLVGCVPKGSQRVIPSLKFYNTNLELTSSQDLLQSNGYNYHDIFLSSHRDGFQAIYQYNCDDSRPWQVGWGWGCIDFREWTITGQALFMPLVFGRTGHNGHPVIDYNGDSFGAAWVSYDDFYFREITSDGRLVGRERTDNIIIGIDPHQSDSRDGARTQIVWNESLQQYGVFNISGKGLFFTTIDRTGVKIQDTIQIETKAYANYAKGQIKAVATGDSFSVLFYDYRDLVIARYAATGQKLNSVIVLEGDRVFPSPLTHQLDFPNMTATDKTLLVVTSEPDTNFGKVFAYDFELKPIAHMSGLIGAPPLVMFHPRTAYDKATGELVVTFKNSKDLGSSMLIRLREK
jgi:hypothetical protein